MPDLTLRDFFEATKGRSVGGADPMIPRYERLNTIIVDGGPLGDLKLEMQRDRESNKRFIELQYMGRALVGCDADLEIEEIRTLPTAAISTTDFEARLKSGRVVRLELARLVDFKERLYVKYISDIAVQARQRITDPQLVQTLAGSISVRFYEPPSEKDVKDAARELAEMIHTHPRLRTPSDTMMPADASMPILNRLKTHVARETAEGNFIVRAQRLHLPKVARVEGLVDQFAPLLKRKESKAQGYASDGHNLWMLFAVESELVFPLGVIEQLRGIEIGPSPFERIMVGCFTDGIIFRTANETPR